jgi:type II secretory ATPase GspE/PulE/Tfp pilus assembly ATPase PilB-like protein
MTEQSPPPEGEHSRRSAADLFLKVHDLDQAAAADTASPPIVRLCNSMLAESLRAGGDQLRVLPPTAEGASIQLLRGDAWIDIMRVPAAVQVPLINRLKVMANLDIARQPLQQGVLKVLTQGEELTLGVEVRLRGDGEEALLQLPPRRTEPGSQEIDAAT